MVASSIVIVIAGLDSAIHPLRSRWMPGSSPGMTKEKSARGVLKRREGIGKAPAPGEKYPHQARAQDGHQDGRHDRSHPVCLCVRDLPGCGRRYGAIGVADGGPAVGRRDQRALLYAAVPAAVATDS